MLDFILFVEKVSKLELLDAPPIPSLKQYNISIDMHVVLLWCAIRIHTYYIYSVQSNTMVFSFSFHLHLIIPTPYSP